MQKCLSASLAWAGSLEDDSDAAVATTNEEAAEELLRRASGAGHGASSSGQARKEPFDGRAFRRSLGKTGRYQRQPKNDAASLALMEEHGVGYSSSGLVAQMRACFFPAILQQPAFLLRVARSSQVLVNLCHCVCD